MNNDIKAGCNSFRRLIIALSAILLFFCMHQSAQAQQEMIVRISEIELIPEYLVEYKAILQYEAEASVRLEPGVIAIYPMFQVDNPTQVRILEIYEGQQAYQSHLKTKHFLKYKDSTLHMIKSLKLVDMTTEDLELTKAIFKKMKK